MQQVFEDFWTREFLALDPGPFSPPFVATIEAK